MIFWWRRRRGSYRGVYPKKEMGFVMARAFILLLYYYYYDVFDAFRVWWVRVCWG